jgi:hypothetical protein
MRRKDEMVYFGSLLVLLSMFMAGIFLHSNIQRLNNEETNYKEIIGYATFVSSKEAQVDYIVDSKKYSGTLIPDSEFLKTENGFITFYYNANDPTKISTSSKERGSLVAAILELGVIIAGITFLSYYFYKKYALRKKETYRKKLELFGYENGCLVYIDKESNDGKANLYYTESTFFREEYEELVANSFLEAELVVYSKNNKWWRIDTTKALEVLNGNS